MGVWCNRNERNRDMIFDYLPNKVFYFNLYSFPVLLSISPDMPLHLIYLCRGRGPSSKVLCPNSKKETPVRSTSSHCTWGTDHIFHQTNNRFSLCLEFWWDESEKEGNRGAGFTCRLHFVLCKNCNQPFHFLKIAHLTACLLKKNLFTVFFPASLVFR